MDWNDYAEIGEALARDFPDENHVMLSDEDLVALVRRLPDFAGGEPPEDADLLLAIRTVWIEALADEPDDDAPLAD